MSERIDPSPVPKPARRRDRDRAPYGTAFLALGLAFASVLGTAFILERPEASGRIAALATSSPLRGIVASRDDAPLQIAKLQAERDELQRRLASAQAVDRTVTGSLGKSAKLVRAPSEPGFSVALGPATTLGSLHEWWDAVRVRVPGETLRPLVHVDEQPDRIEFRLLLGPLGAQAEAAELCNKLADIAPNCAAAPFDGQKLSDR